MPIDLNVRIPSSERLGEFEDMARRLGITGIAPSTELDKPTVVNEKGLVLYSRADLKGKRIHSLKKELGLLRRRAVIVAFPLAGVETSNWAAEDRRVDLLTLGEDNIGRILKDSTANMARHSGTALEIQFTAILQSTGLNRSRVFKSFREATRTALDAGMKVVLSSGASHPIHMRAPMATTYIGFMLGMNRVDSKEAVFHTPQRIVERNERKLSSEFVGPGVEIVKRGGNREKD